MLDISSFKTTNALEDFSIRQINDQKDFIADEIFSPVVIKRSDYKKYQYDLSVLRDAETQSNSKAKANLVDYGVFTSSGKANLHKLAGEVDPADERDADAAVANIEQDTASVILQKLLIRRELEMATLVSTSGSYPAALTSSLSAGSTWADSNGDPEADAATARTAVKGVCGVPANALALSWTGLEKLKQSPALKDRLKYTSGQSLTEEQIKNLLGVQYLHVCKAQYNSANDGAANVIADIWDDFALFYVKNPSQSLRTMCYGRFYVVNHLYTHQYMDEERGSGAGRIKMLEMGWEWDLAAGAVVSSSDGDFAAGYYLDNIY